MYSNASVLCFICVIGTVMFVVGMVINIHSDHVLRNLRKPNETGYKIPTGKYSFSCNSIGDPILYFTADGTDKVCTVLPLDLQLWARWSWAGCSLVHFGM